MLHAAVEHICLGSQARTIGCRVQAGGAAADMQHDQTVNVPVQNRLGTITSVEVCVLAHALVRRAQGDARARTHESDRSYIEAVHGI